MWTAAGKKQPKPATKLKPLFWAKFNAQVSRHVNTHVSLTLVVGIRILERNQRRESGT